MDKCRCKFRLNKITKFHGSSTHNLEFITEYDPTLPEDVRFSKSTPSGSITISVDNPAAVEFFLQNKTGFYVDFEAVPEQPKQ